MEGRQGRGGREGGKYKLVVVLGEGKWADGERWGGGGVRREEVIGCV